MRGFRVISSFAGLFNKREAMPMGNYIWNKYFKFNLISFKYVGKQAKRHNGVKVAIVKTKTYTMRIKINLVEKVQQYVFVRMDTKASEMFKHWYLTSLHIVQCDTVSIIVWIWSDCGAIFSK